MAPLSMDHSHDRPIDWFRKRVSSTRGYGWVAQQASNTILVKNYKKFNQKRSAEIEKARICFGHHYGEEYRRKNACKAHVENCPNGESCPHDCKTGCKQHRESLSSKIEQQMRLKEDEEEEFELRIIGLDKERIIDWQEEQAAEEELQEQKRKDWGDFLQGNFVAVEKNEESGNSHLNICQQSAYKGSTYQNTYQENIHEGSIHRQSTYQESTYQPSTIRQSTYQEGACRTSTYDDSACAKSTFPDVGSPIIQPSETTFSETKYQKTTKKQKDWNDFILKNYLDFNKDEQSCGSTYQQSTPAVESSYMGSTCTSLVGSYMHNTPASTPPTKTYAENIYQKRTPSTASASHSRCPNASRVTSPDSFYRQDTRASTPTTSIYEKSIYGDSTY